MTRNKHWLRTNEYTDTESSLRKAAQLVSCVETDSSEWKWLLIAVHSATQGMFVLSLSLGNGFLTLKSPHAVAWLKAYQSGGPWPTKMELDYFLDLYKKTKKHSLNSTWQASMAHDDAMFHLNELRNGFIHFGAQGWAIQLAGLPGICLRSLEVVDQLGWHSDQVLWQSLAQSKRARRSLNSLRRELKRIEKGMAPT